MHRSRLQHGVHHGMQHGVHGTLCVEGHSNAIVNRIFTRIGAMQMQGLANGTGRLATTAAPFMKTLQHGVGSKKMARFPRAFLQTWRLATKLGIRKGFASSYCLVFFPNETLTSKQKSGKLPRILSVVKCCSCKFCNLGAEPFVENEDGG